MLMSATYDVELEVHTVATAMIAALTFQPRHFTKQTNKFAGEAQRR